MTLEQQAKVKQVLEFYETKLPKASAHQRIQLKFLTGQLFLSKLKQYSKPLIVKGVPPLIKDLKELYSDKEKVKLIEELLTGHLKSMEERSTLADDDEE